MIVGVPNSYDFTLPFLLDNVSMLHVHFSQGDRIIRTKWQNEFEAGSKTVSVTLDKDESSLFIPGREANIKISVLFDDGTPWESEEGAVGVYGDLASGVT